MFWTMIRLCAVTHVTSGFTSRVIQISLYDKMLQKPSENPWLYSECIDKNGSTHVDSTARKGISCPVFV